ncbi:hypothetical protein [Levilactobacillus cerevisiae]|nr:hypothetical protein [Levilactobacillus cerevisiae]
MQKGIATSQLLTFPNHFIKIELGFYYILMKKELNSGLKGNNDGRAVSIR